MITDALTYLSISGTAALVTAAIIGLLFCFMGYKVLRFCISLAGFAAGAVLGSFLCPMFKLGDSQYEILIVLGCAIIAAILCYKIFKLGIFVLAAYCGFALIATFMDDRVVAIAVAAAIGILAVIFMRSIIILATAFGGSALAGSSIMQLAGVQESAAVIILVIVLALGGMCYQFRFTRKR